LGKSTEVVGTAGGGSGMVEDQRKNIGCPQLIPGRVNVIRRESTRYLPEEKNPKMGGKGSLRAKGGPAG